MKKTVLVAMVVVLMLTAACGSEHKVFGQGRTCYGRPDEFLATYCTPTKIEHIYWSKGNFTPCPVNVVTCENGRVVESCGQFLDAENLKGWYVIWKADGDTLGGPYSSPPNFKDGTPIPQ